VGKEKEPILPLTASHRVGIVSMYSYSDIVNPGRLKFGPRTKVVQEKIHTIDLVMILHVQEWIIIKVAEEVDVRSTWMVKGQKRLVHGTYSTL
jgi:hypothetical protein